MKNEIDKEVTVTTEEKPRPNRVQRRAKAKYQKKLAREMKATLQRWGNRKKNKDIIPQGATLTETMNKMTDAEKIDFYAKMYKAVVDKRTELEREAAANGNDENQGQ